MVYQTYWSNCYFCIRKGPRHARSKLLRLPVVCCVEFVTKVWTMDSNIKYIGFNEVAGDISFSAITMTTTTYSYQTSYLFPNDENAQYK